MLGVMVITTPGQDGVRGEVQTRIFRYNQVGDIIPPILPSLDEVRKPLDHKGEDSGLKEIHCRVRVY